MTRERSLFASRVVSIRAHLLAAVAMVALTVPPSEATASMYGYDDGTYILVGGIAVAGVAGAGLLVYDIFDFESDSEPSYWNAGWDLALGVPFLLLTLVGAADSGLPTAGERVEFAALVAATGTLIGHGIWEINRMGESESPPSGGTTQSLGSMSLTPVVLNREGNMGFGVVGRF